MKVAGWRAVEYEDHAAADLSRGSATREVPEGPIPRWLSCGGPPASLLRPASPETFTCATGAGASKKKFHNKSFMGGYAKKTRVSPWLCAFGKKQSTHMFAQWNKVEIPVCVSSMYDVFPPSLYCCPPWPVHWSLWPRTRERDRGIDICYYIYLYIYIYTYIYIYIYTYTYTYKYTYTHIHIYTYTHIHIYTYTHIHIHTYTHILYIYIYTYIHVYVIIYIYIHIYIGCGAGAEASSQAGGLIDLWLRTTGVNTNGAAAKVMNFDRLWKKVIMPWHFWEDKSRLTGVPKRSLCQKAWNSQWPH